MKRSKIIIIGVIAVILVILGFNYIPFFIPGTPKCSIRKYYWSDNFKEIVIGAKEIDMGEEEADVIKNQIIKSIRDKVTHEGNWIDKTDCVSKEDIEAYEVKTISGTSYAVVYRNNYDETKDKWIVYGTSPNR